MILFVVVVVNNRKLSPKEQEQLRLRIIRTAKKNLKPNGKPNVTLVAEICECSNGHVSTTWKKYSKDGVSAVKAVKMGRPKNSGYLTPEQQKQIRKMIVDKCPEQLKLKGFLWNRQSVCDLVYRLFKVTITVQGMSKYLKKWGFTPQRPTKRHYKQNPVEIQKWLDEKYPAIKSRANEEDAEIMWCDETGCQNESNYVKGWAPKAQTPILPISTEKLRINMISAISNKGKLRFMFYEDSMNATIFITFLERLIKGADRKIFLIVDNLKAHHAVLVKEWLEKHKSKIEIFYLPPYAPEYNPDEYLNGEIKRSMANRGYSTSIKELESKARSIVKTIQCNTEKVVNYFKAKHVRYAM